MGISALLWLVSACVTKSFDTKEELWTYLKESEHNYHFEKKIKGVRYSLTYKPTDLLVDQELGSDHTEREVDSLRKKYNQYLYFNLGMSANGQELLNLKVGDQQAFGATVKQFAFGMANKIHLIGRKRDTLPMADYIYPRMYGMGNSTNMLLVYRRDKRVLQEEFFHLTIEDLGFATGEIRFKVPTKPLNNEPILHF